jgi:hypothetical protein
MSNLKEIFSISIDLNKIDESKIKEVKLKNGNTALFYDVSLFINDEPDQYNNIGSIATGQTKEEREARTPKTYIGNAKRQWSANNPNPTSTATGLTQQESDDLPF